MATAKQKAASKANLVKARAKRKLRAKDDEAFQARTAHSQRLSRGGKPPFSPFTNAGMNLYMGTGSKADAKRIAHFKETVGILQGIQRRQGKKVSKMPRGLRGK